jgi:putative protein-disulfide isomerase
LAVQKNQQVKNNTQFLQQADLVEIIYYTDPLCCWSWAFEPEWQKLLNAFKQNITWRYCMGGLLPGWNNYHDAVNSISKPMQMAPMWMHASKLTGVDIKYNLWAKDPPASSYPACIAVKCAQLQSDVAGEKYLYLLRKACMIEEKNIAKQTVLTDTAILLAEDAHLNFDVALFNKNLSGDEGSEAFRKDLQEVRYYAINRFPSLVIKHGKTAKLITGFHPFEIIAETINNFLNKKD